MSAATIAAAGTIRFTRVPSYQPLDTQIRIIATDLHSDCDPAVACANGGGYFNAATVQLWAFATPYPMPGQVTSGVPAGFPLATAPVADYDAAAGYSNANQSSVPYSAPPPGTYYLSMLIVGSNGPISNIVVYDAYNFSSPVTLGAQAPPTPELPVVSVAEYYNAAMDHYFMTPLPVEIALCNAGQAPCDGWVPTGKSFNAFAGGDEPPWSAAVCRFYNDSFAPKSSHFYALHGEGCEVTLQDFPDWQLESSDLFAMDSPLADGTCGQGYVPVYRLYNNGMGGAPNHRFTMDPDVRNQMTAIGWIPEGLGVAGVAFCSPVAVEFSQSHVGSL